MVDSAAAVNVPPLRSSCLLALLVCLLVASLLPSAPAAEAAVAAAPAPTCTNAAFWRCRHLLGTLRPTSVTSDGLSLFMMDPPNARIEQLRFNADGSFTQIGLPWLPVRDVTARLGSLVLGPRAFYAIVTFPDDDVGIDASVPYLFRADRIPTAVSGGWRLLRQTAGAADVGLASVVMNRTVWMLRSCSEDCLDARRKGSNSAFAVDWQPLATENSQILQPPGPTIDLGDAVRARPAAGVTATTDAIYVFGGHDTPTAATRIPLKNGTPGTPIEMPPLRNERIAATALVHGTSVYLVGGSQSDGQPTEPVIERARIEQRADPRTGTVIGNVQRWERLPAPILPAGVTIATATFARGQLWIIRSDGWVETMDVGTVAPGQSRLAWAPASVSINGGQPFDAVAPRPIKVRHGDTVDLTLEWSYTGAQTLEGVTVEVAGQPADPGKKSKSPPFLTATTRADYPAGTTVAPGRVDFSAGALTLLPPTSDGLPIQLQARIPTEVTDPRRKDNRPVPDRRTEYNATVQVTAGGQRLGPVQRLRFVIERPRPR
jgi:hypothetical protein